MWLDGGATGKVKATYAGTFHSQVEKRQPQEKLTRVYNQRKQDK